MLEEAAQHVAQHLRAAREAGIGGAFDDCPAIRKQCHFVRLFPEFQDELGVANAAMGLKTFAHIAEIHRTMVLVNLYRIPAAKRDVRATRSSQMNKVS